MDKKTTEETIAVAIIEKNVDSLINKMSSSSFKNEVKYHADSINKSMVDDFKQITEILQHVVDSYYYNSYVVDSFVAFHIDDYDFCVEHNLSLANSMKKVLKFVK